MKFRFLLCFFICAFTTFAQTRDVNVLISLAYGGAETTYQIKDVQRANVIVQSANEASMTVLRKDGGTLPNIRTLIFVAKEDANIRFINYDGTVLQSSNVAFGEIPQYTGVTPVRPATVEYTYTFSGWNPTIEAVTEDKTYTATYSAVKNQYEIIFQNEDGTELQRSNVTYGETPVYAGASPTKPATAEYTYTFAGWTPTISVVTGSQTYTATFNAVKKQYEIIFQNEDGTVLQRSNFAYGVTPTYSGITPTKPSSAENTYTFAGWSPAITPVTGSQIYTATFTTAKNQYEIIFQNEDGTALQRSNFAYGVTPVYSGATPTKVATSEYTYTFAGWTPTISAVTGSQTYTATFNAVKNQYEIIFQNEDGTELQRSNVAYGETPVYSGATPTKPATAEFIYTFTGWAPTISPVIGAQTYTATYSSLKKKYTLTAKPQENIMGVVSGSGTYDYGTQVVVIATPKFGYDFNMWDNGLTEKEIVIELVSDSTVIALFTENYCEQHTTPEIPTMEVQPIAVWGSELNLTESDNAIKEAISQQEGKIAEIKESALGSSERSDVAVSEMTFRP